MQLEIIILIKLIQPRKSHNLHVFSLMWLIDYTYLQDVLGLPVYVP